MEESLKERQENELEVLQAIFMGDFRDLNDENKVICMEAWQIYSCFVTCIVYIIWGIEFKSHIAYIFSFDFCFLVFSSKASHLAVQKLAKLVIWYDLC